MRKLVRILVGAVWLSLCAGVAVAQSFPVKPIRIIVPGPAGGSPDLLARIIGPRLSESLGQPVLVDNRPGAGGTLGTALAAEAPPDGHTVLLAFAAHAFSPALYRNLSYDPIDAFSPVVMVATVTPVLVVHQSHPANSLKELISLARSKRAAVNWASAGNGTMSHLLGEMLRSMTGADLLHVPYKGGAPALSAVLAGEASSYVPNIPTVLTHIKAGQLKAIAVTSAVRSPLLPEVPTFAEAGIQGFDVIDWFGFLAPARTPPEVVSRLNAEINSVLRSAGVQDRLRGAGFEVVGGTSTGFGARIRSDAEKWDKVVKASGAKVD